MNNEAEKMAKQINGDCDICPCLKSCLKLGKKGIKPDCTEELTKHLKGAKV